MSGLDDARFWLDLGQWMITIALAGYVWFSNRQSATVNQIDAVERISRERLDRHGDRLTRIESDLEHVPTPSSIEGLTVKLGALHGDFRYMKGWMEGIQGSLKQLESSVGQLVENELRGNKS